VPGRWEKLLQQRRLRRKTFPRSGGEGEKFAAKDTTFKVLEGAQLFWSRGGRRLEHFKRA